MKPEDISRDALKQEINSKLLIDVLGTNEF